MTITNAEKQHTANVRPPHQLPSTHMPFHHCYYTLSPNIRFTSKHIAHTEDKLKKNNLLHHRANDSVSEKKDE
jgi:hypothetical protein